MVKRYRGNSGEVSWIEEQPPRAPDPAPASARDPAPTAPKAPPRIAPRQPAREQGNPLSLLSSLDSGDLLMLLVLYLLYRESGDTELLLILAALLIV